MVQDLRKFIADNYDTKAEFARLQGVAPCQVSWWLKSNFIVVNGALYSKRRGLIKKGEDDE